VEVEIESLFYVEKSAPVFEDPCLFFWERFFFSASFASFFAMTRFVIDKNDYSTESDVLAEIS